MDEKLTKRLKIGFVWQGSSEPEIMDNCKDGLWAALQVIKQIHEVTWFEPWDKEIENVDLILYHEAPCTINGKNSEYYNRIRKLPIRKALLFAGGPLKKEWIEGFDLLFIESEINVEECISLGIPYIKAFGINTDIFKPVPQNRIFDTIHHGTFAAWKHQPLIAEALGPKALLIGQFQKHEQFLIDNSLKYGSFILPKLPPESLSYFISSAHTCTNFADVWGGGQRTTLEAMACGIPVICRTDSPKCREYVESSGFGEVIEPSVEQIRLAVQRLKEKNLDPQIGIKYVNDNWNHKQYAEKILNWINDI